MVDSGIKSTHLEKGKQRSKKYLELSLSIEYEAKWSDNKSTENEEIGDARQNRRIEKNVSVEVQY
jgi:hypothetical protein